MRITFVLGQIDLTGGCRVVSEYAQRLMSRGHRVTVVSTPPVHISFGRRLLNRLRGDALARVRWPKGSHFDGTPVEVRMLETRRPLTDADVPDADVVISTWWETAEWTQALSASKGAKVYFIQHHETHEAQPLDRVRATWRFPQQKIVVASWLARVAEREFGDPNALVVPNSVDLLLFDAPPRQRRSPPVAGLLYAPLTPWKGTALALEAYRRARSRIPELRLVLLSHLAPSAALPVPAGAAFHQNPAQAQLASIYGGCDVWIHGARTEGFGLPILEAFACRCPAVSTRCGGPEDIIEDGVNGFLVPVDDVDALTARALEILTVDEPAWERMSEAARRRAERYTWDDATRLFESALRHAVETRAGL